MPVANGGTGASTTPQGLINLGIAAYLATNGLALPVPVSSGGTGANNVFQARINLGAAPLNNPNFTGNPTAPTPPSSDSSQTLATTAFVQTAFNNMLPISIAHGGTGASTPPQALLNLGAAPINNPSFTGVPFAPNPNPGTANQQIATTAFVMAAVGSGGGGGAPPVTYGPTPPNNPAVGQLWFDTGTSTLMVWSGSAWTVTVPSGAAGPPGPPGTNFVSDTPPGIPPAVAGNMWWDSTDGQLYVLFNNQGTLQWVVANNQPGPAGATGATGPAGPVGPPGTPWPEAPTDGSLYGRDGATASWQLVPPEAPLGGLAYLRIGGNQSNPGSWVPGLPISGGTLTGALVLDGNATVALNPVPLQQLNSATALLAPINNPTFTGTVTIPAGASIAGYVTTANANATFLPLAGGTLTGQLNGTVINVSGTISLPASAAQFGSSLLNVQGAGANSGATLYSNAGGAAANIGVGQAATALVYWYFGTTLIAGVSTNGSSVTYNTTSDGRLKSDVAPVSNSGTLIDTLTPVTFEWTANPSLGTDYGFIAQDVESVFPMAVTAGNALQPGEPGFVPWQIDQSKLMPLAIAELKALRARVASLVAAVVQLQGVVGTLQQNANETVTAWDVVS